MFRLSRKVVAAAALMVCLPVWAYNISGQDWTWQAAPVQDPFYFNAASFPAATGSQAEVEAAFTGSLDAWNDQAAADLFLQYGGLTSSTTMASNGTQVSAYTGSNTGGATLAVATMWFSGGNITECDIEFFRRNGGGTIDWSADPAGAAFDEIDLQNVATHEVGHCIGLNHSNDPDAIMYASTTGGTGPNERLLDADDIAGAQAIYGLGCLDDNDNDGFNCSIDCDDTDPDVNPDATETCTTPYDDDCDGTTVNGSDGTPWYEDFDGDGYGDENASGTNFCSDPGAGWSATADDCDDFSPSYNPGATEYCDGADTDCNPATLDGSGEDWYLEPCDGTGDSDYCEEGIWDCVAGPAIVCSDNTGSTVETCNGADDDCDGLTDENLLTIYYHDADLDGYTVQSDSVAACDDPDGAGLEWLDFFTSPGDCDDANDAIHPFADEACDGLDNDCTGATPDGSDESWYHTPCDGADTDECAEGQWQCGVGTQTCDDVTNGTVEVCNNSDDDCDGTIDEGVQLTWYRDGDRDGYTDVEETMLACTDPDGPGNPVWVGSPTLDDCNDADAAVFPGALETCDSVDNDCDPATGDGIDETWFGAACDGADSDSCEEGFNYCDGTGPACDDVTGDDVEVCNGLDEDCDGTNDNGVLLTWWHDSDGDGFTSDTDTQLACTDPDGPGTEWLAAPTANDCDDTEPTTWPGAPEACDAVDNDCDGATNDGVDEAWVNDFCDGADTDSCDEGTLYCDGTGQPACSDTTGDNVEVCDGADNDCNGQIDEGVLLTFWHDADGDGFTSDSDTQLSCSDPDGGAPGWLPAATANDCDDGAATTYPGAPELCDTVDNDCDVATVDGIGAVWLDEPCDGGDSDSCDEGKYYCGAGGTQACDDVTGDDVEVCNGLDDDCDGTNDNGVLLTWWRDADGDGFTSDTDTQLACSDPDGPGTEWLAAATATDCDDAVDTTFPGAQERCDTVDNDCDGATFDGQDEAWFGEACDGGDSDMCEEGFAYCDAGGDQACDDTTGDDVEVCNGLDEDCDGVDDNGVLLTFWHDSDGDGFTSDTDTQLACTDPDDAGTAWLGTPTVNDCDDTVDTTFPGAPEQCDTVDNDCDSGTGDGGDEAWFGDPCDGGDSDSCDEGFYYCDGAGAQACDDLTADDVEVCNGLDEDCDGVIDNGVLLTWWHDTDRDGFTNNSDTQQACVDPDGGGPRWVDTATTNDCDDLVDTTYPGATEACDTVDNDCDPATEDGSDEAWFDLVCDGSDSDSCDEGFFFCDAGQQACDDATGDDVEVCNGSDDDCNGTIDDGVLLTWWHDSDGDGFTSDTDTQQACTDPDGGGTAWVGAATAHDCDDAVDTTYPGAPERCDTVDNDCDVSSADGSDEGWIGTECDGGDSDSCDEGQYFCDGTGQQACSDISGDNTEVCDGSDNDCNGQIDDGVQLTFWRDGDGDGFTSLSDTQLACSDPDGPGSRWLAAPTSDDCDDTVASTYPGAAEACDTVDNDCDVATGDGIDEGWFDAACDGGDSDSCDEGFYYCDGAGQQACDDVTSDDIEVCDGDDNDCNGQIDDGVLLTWWHDADGDGFTSDVDTQVGCTDPDGAGLAWLGSPTANDCDDAVATTYPGAVEACDTVDNDCDGATVDGSDETWFDVDCDGDDTDSCDEGVYTCDASGQQLCDDFTDDNLEVCDTVDNDCNGQIDDVTVITWYRDADGDGFTNNTDTQDDCADPDGAGTEWVHLPTTQDCDDTVATTFPGAPEICDDVDNDCDGSTGDGAGEAWIDTDCDGGDADSCDEGLWFCAAGGVKTCDDASGDNLEVCNGVDDDCNGTIDDGFTLVTFWHDGDGDGFVSLSDSVQACADPDGSGAAWLDAATADDCDDVEATTYPGAAEACDTVDNDCDNATVDGSGESWFDVPCDGDDSDSCEEGVFACDSTGTQVCGDTTGDDVEVCNGGDDDCNGTVDDGVQLTFWHDSDGDGFTGDTLLACADPDGAGTEWLDAATALDCDDTVDTVFPGATEACDAVDNDCDPATPDGDDEGWVGELCDGADSDSCNEGVRYCDAGAMACSDDSGDNIEVCDGSDNDCNGQTDEGVQTTWFHDADGDGFTDVSDNLQACTDPDGAGPNWVDVATTTDCDDAVATTFPGASELCDTVDNDCDGTTNDGTGEAWFGAACDGADSDSCDEGFFYCGAGEQQCDDTSGDDVEVCNGQDDDCDGTPDDGVTTTWYHDADGDGFTALADTQLACTDPDGAGTAWVATPTADDCDDAEATTHPGATESCDQVDNDCNGSTVDGEDESWFDVACDGGDSDSCDEGVFTCDASGTQVCDDTTGDDVEVCNGLDDDCNGTPDDGVLTTWYPDADGDGFTALADARQACTDPDGAGTGWVPTATADDCDDTVSTTFPGAPEACDTVDNDCDGATLDGVGELWLGQACDGGDSDSCDEGFFYCDGAGVQQCDDTTGDDVEICNGLDDDCDGTPDQGMVFVTFFHDADGDGFTSASDTLNVCSDPDGAGTEWVDTATADDCDDAVATTFPGATEACDTVDNDCDSGTVDGADASWFGVDCDGDDADSCDEGVFTCLGGTQTCDDTSDDNIELCDNIDNDCDGMVDEGAGRIFYHDADGDGYNTDSDTQVSCVDPDGPSPAWIATHTEDDCDDTVDSTHPGAVELCDDVDNDCDGATPDGVGEAWIASDCDGDDADSCDEGLWQCAAGVRTCSDVTPDNVETCDGVDEDCNGLIDDGVAQTWYRDGDSDGFTSGEDFQDSCTDPDGDGTEWLAEPSDEVDCDDWQSAAWPGATELDDGIDNNCDGRIDEGFKDPPDPDSGDTETDDGKVDDGGGCGCDQGGGVAWLWLVLPLALRRR